MEIRCTGPNSISHFFSEANYRFQAAWQSWTRALTVLCLQESSYLLLLISRPSLRSRAGLVQQLLPYMTQGFSPPAFAAEGIPPRTTATWARPCHCQQHPCAQNKGVLSQSTRPPLLASLCFHLPPCAERPSTKIQHEASTSSHRVAGFKDLLTPPLPWSQAPSCLS